MQHHPIFESFLRVGANSDPLFDVNFVGSRVRHTYEAKIETRGVYGSGRCSLINEVDPSLPLPTSEDYLEWIDLMEAILDADSKFVMVEAGAGYGRWLVNAANAIRNLKHSQITDFTLVGIEPDPTRFAYMEQHFLDNHLLPKAHWLIQAGVSDRSGFAFQKQAQNPMWAYGDELIHSAELDQLAESIPNAELVSNEGSVTARGVPCVTLSSVLERFERVDLVDADLQGEELRVTRECISALNQKVKRLHYGTHSEAIEAGLREILSQNGWIQLNDYSLGKRSATPFGVVSFIDGIQSWMNPRLVRAEVIRACQKRLSLMRQS
jgi:FkbM family methyltransferase